MNQRPETNKMDARLIREFVARAWAEHIVPTLCEYVTIPNQSPAFDPEWREHGYMDRAVALVAGWIEAQGVPGLRLDVVRLDGRTPLLFVEVVGDTAETVLLYGHLDKQPPMHGWAAGLGPWEPVVRDGKLYGRGAADDGYAAFAAVTAIKALKTHGVPCARCVIVIEACEESGSYDLPPYIDLLSDRLGRPGLVIGLDSGCGDYDRLWVTSSLRGLLNGHLGVSTLTEGVHSGAASGIVPSTFRVLRRVLSRLEDEETGRVRIDDLYVDIPEERVRQAEAMAATLGASVHAALPFHGTTRPVSDDVTELLLNRTWRPQVEVTGAAGLPPLDRAGNVLRPTTTVKLSVRLPPTADASRCAQRLKAILEADPPYGATVSFDPLESSPGWNVPPFAPWLAASLRDGSIDVFGREACFMGEGGTIPFMAMLGARFPQAQFVITGVLGPQSNAHGPNEFLHLATGERVTCCVARVLADHAAAAAR